MRRWLKMRKLKELQKMYKEINLTITEHSYLKELTEFNKETLVKDFAKVVQLKVV